MKYKFLLVAMLAVFSYSASKMQEYIAGKTQAPSGPVVIKFYGSTCPPCNRLAEAMRNFPSQYPNVTFYSADASNPKNLALKKELQAQKNLKGGVPVLVFFASGNDIESKKMTGDPIVGFAEGQSFIDILKGRISALSKKRGAPEELEQIPAKKPKVMEEKPVMKKKEKRKSCY
ncbi:thioredoxin family protein [Candidatus Dependentiae bacterium]|nr:thioredoxin family protein [Candidatus Dependentiae bacterium]